MKPAILPILLFLLIYSAQPVSAQEDFTFDRALSDYVYTLDLYRTAHRLYQLKKAEYLKFKTLTSQTDAQTAGLDMLSKRDDVIRTHLTALRLKLAETPGVNPVDREANYSRLDQEVTWLYQHQDKLRNTANLSELTRISKELESRYPAIQILMYQSVTAVLAGKQNHLRDNLQNQSIKLNAKTAEIKVSGENIQLLERWLLQANQRLELSHERQTAAEVLTHKLTSQTRNLPEQFLQVQFALKESHQYLKETASSLQEIIREIKS